MADILSQYQFAYTIRIICFSAEEIGTWGSWHYAMEARERGDEIKAVLNFDVIGYWVPGLPRDLNIEYNAESEWLADEVIRVARQYTDTDTKKHEPYWPPPPDHRRFWDQGYHAVWFDEAGNLAEASPYVNTSEDVIDYVNKSFLYNNIKVAVAAAAQLAVPVKIENGN
jgi:leucyl aminopeptidase